MWPVLRQPRWLGYLTLALLFGVGTTLLGLWQYGRYEDKAERRDVFEANYDAAPAALTEVLRPGRPLPTAEEWRRVEASGRYDADHQFFVRNRPNHGLFGYEVLVPLVFPDGTAIVVDRGWVPNAESAAVLPDVPEPPSGPVTVTGWLRSAEPDLGRDLPAGQLASIDPEEVGHESGLDVYGAYLLQETEAPAAAGTLTPLPPPDLRLGPHFAYALQWWLTVPAGVILVLVMARQQARDAQGIPRRSPARDGTRGMPLWDDEDE